MLDLEQDATKKKKKRKVRFVEGWVEFKDKKIAKQAANMLNNTSIGGPKRSPFRDDLWSLKYLKDFKWHHIKEGTGTSHFSFTFDATLTLL